MCSLDGRFLARWGILCLCGMLTDSWGMPLNLRRWFGLIQSVTVSQALIRLLAFASQPTPRHARDMIWVVPLQSPEEGTGLSDWLENMLARPSRKQRAGRAAETLLACACQMSIHLPSASGADCWPRTGHQGRRGLDLVAPDRTAPTLWCTHAVCASPRCFRFVSHTSKLASGDAFERNEAAAPPWHGLRINRPATQFSVGQDFSGEAVCGPV
jgi:hypothetical protein